MKALQHPVFRRLFASQIMSLLGIGIMTVALALMAYRIGGTTSAAKILGSIFALKMIAYVALAPLAEVVFANIQPKRVLISLDLLRLCLLVPMAFASEIWQFGLLLFVFYAASAAFTPLYQSIIPDVLPAEKTYTEALALSRLAYTLEAMLSPVFAGLALLLVSAESLFSLSALCLAGSVLSLWLAAVPDKAHETTSKNFIARLSNGLRIYTRTPRLQGLFTLNLALSFIVGWILVNSVVFAAQRLGSADHFYTYLMASYGGGAAVAALCVPSLLQRMTERRLMTTGGFLFGILSALIVFQMPLAGVLLLWCAFGVASSLVLTPGGLVLTRSAAKSDRPAVFAAQFSMSHAGWLLAYPTAGWLGAELGLENSLLILGALCTLITLLAIRIWPANDPIEREHAHPELSTDHPHLISVKATGPEHRHAHPFYIDDLHLKWTAQ